MLRMIRFALAAMTAVTLPALAPVSIGAKPAAAAMVYCKTAGVPTGCVPRPTTGVVYCTAPGLPVGCVVRPTVAVVYCTSPGLPVGCVVRPAKPVVVAPVVVAPRVYAPGTAWNRGGPVNRVGRR